MLYSWGRGTALSAICLTFASGGLLFGQTPATLDAPSARALKVALAPSLDGRVADDPAWEMVPPLTDFWQTAPEAGQPASERTEVRIAYTEDALYFGVTLYDRSAEGLTLSDSRRDSPLDDVDSFRILLDTYKDRQNGFVFATNPAALEYDGQVIGEGGLSVGGGGTGGRQQGGSGGGFNLNWDGAWRVRTAMTEDGWSAEFEIPFRTLRYEPGASREWGMNFQRTIRRRKESAYWAPLPFQFDLLKVSQAGTLAGLDLPAQRNLKLIPYALGELRERGVQTSRRRARGRRARRQVQSHSQPYPRRHRQHRLRAGRGRRAAGQPRPLQPVLSGEAAVLPRERGALRRGRSGEAEVFFSRRIGISDTGVEIPIIAGGRLSGKTGPVNVGLLNMQTDDLGGTPMNNFTVARVRRDFANRSNLGADLRGPPCHRRQGRIERPQRLVRGRRAMGRRPHRAGLGVRGALRHPRAVERPACVSACRAERDPAAHAQRRGHRDRAELQPGGRLSEPAWRLPQVRGAGLFAPAAREPVEVSGDPATLGLSRVLEPVGLPRDRLLAHRQPLGTEDRLGVPHRDERDARGRGAPLRHLPGRHGAPRRIRERRSAARAAEQSGRGGLRAHAGDQGRLLQRQPRRLQPAATGARRRDVERAR